MNENLQKAVLYIISGILIFIFSPWIISFLFTLILGNNWVIQIYLSFIAVPALAFIGLWIIYTGIICLREYMKNRKNEIEPQ